MWIAFIWEMTAPGVCLHINGESGGGIIMADVFWLRWRCQKPVLKFSWHKWTFLAVFLILNFQFEFRFLLFSFFFASGFVQPSYPLLFLIWSFKMFSEEPLARSLSTPSPAQIFRSESCSSHCCVCRQQSPQAAQLFWKLGCVSLPALELNAALVLCGWALLLFLTWEGMSASSGCAHIRAASCRRGL